MDSLIVKLFTLSLLLSWICAASSATAATAATFRTSPILSQPTSAALAADTLRSRGYTTVASLLISISTTTNFSGTLLAPPDYAFSFPTAKILHRRPAPRPSVPFLLYHTLRPPLILTGPSLSSRDDGDELRTYYNNFCLHLFKNGDTGEVTISSSPFKNPMSAVKIRQPDLYVDDRLTVHGIDGVLNPLLGTRCSVTYTDPSAEAVSLQVNRVFLDYAMRALRRKGYNVAAAAMNIRREDLLSLTSFTMFAVSDEHLFMAPGGYRYDFRHHVIPMRHSFADLAKMTEGRRVRFSTLAPNKTVAVAYNDGSVTVDGVPVGIREVYHNRWMVVVSVISSLDEFSETPTPTSGDSEPSPSPYPDIPPPPPVRGKSISGIFGRRKPKRATPPVPEPETDSSTEASDITTDSDWARVPSPAPIQAKPHRLPSRTPVPGVFGRRKPKRVPPPASDSEIDSDLETSDETTEFDFGGAPSPAAEDSAPSDGIPSSSPSPSQSAESEVEDMEYSVSSPAPPPAPEPEVGKINVIHCDLNVVISDGVEGGDLLCPDRHARKLTGRFSGDDVERYQPLDGHGQDAEDLPQSDEAKIAQHVNIADDVFFYT